MAGILRIEELLAVFEKLDQKLQIMEEENRKLKNELKDYNYKLKV